MGSCAKPKSKKPLTPSASTPQSSRGEGGGGSCSPEVDDKSHLFLNTNGVCFLCFEDCPPDVPDADRQKNLQTSINFCRLASRYLGFNLQKLVESPLKKGRNCKSLYKNLEEENDRPRNRVGVELCDKCLTLAEGFCKLHFQVEFHQMILDRCVRSISEVIKEANKKSQKALFTISDDEEALNKQQKTFTRLTLGGFRSAHNVRNKIYKKSIEKLSRSFPVISLRKICKSGEWISLLNGKRKRVKIASKKRPNKLVSGSDSSNGLNPDEVLASMMGCIASLWIVLSLSFINPEELIKKVKVDRLVGMQQKLLDQQHSIIQFAEAQGQIPVEVLNVPMIAATPKKEETSKTRNRPGPKRRGRPPAIKFPDSSPPKAGKDLGRRTLPERNINGMRKISLRKPTENKTVREQPSSSSSSHLSPFKKGDTATTSQKLSPKDVQPKTENAQKESKDKNSEVLTWKSKSPKYPTTLEPIQPQAQPTSQPFQPLPPHPHPPLAKPGVSISETVDQHRSPPKSAYQPQPRPQEYQPPPQHVPPQPQPYAHSGVVPPPPPQSYTMPSHSYYSQQSTTEGHPSSHPPPHSSYPSTSPMMHSQSQSSYDPSYYYNNAPPPTGDPAVPSQYNYGYNYSSYNYSAPPTPAPPPTSSSPWQSYETASSLTPLYSASEQPYSSYHPNLNSNPNDSYYGAYYSHNQAPPPQPQVGTSGIKQDYSYENYNQSQNYYYAQTSFPPPPPPNKNPDEQAISATGGAHGTCPSAGTPSPPLTYEEPKNTESSADETIEEMDTGPDDDDDEDYEDERSPSQARKSAEFQALSIFPEVHWRQQQDMPKIRCTVSGCNEQFVRTDHLDLHLRAHGSFHCNFCPMTFSKAHSLALHEKGRHARPSSSGTSSNKSKCSRCDFNSASQNNFFIHFLSDHLNIQLYDQSCEICKKKFVAGARKYVKRNHFKNYHDTEGKSPNSIFRCKLCNAPFLKESQLKDHASYCEGPIGRELGQEEESDVYDEMPSRSASVVSSVDTAISFDIAHATAAAITM